MEQENPVFLKSQSKAMGGKLEPTLYDRSLLKAPTWTGLEAANGQLLLIGNGFFKIHK